MAIKPNFLTSMGYHIFLTMVLRARGAPLLNLQRLTSQITLQNLMFLRERMMEDFVQESESLLFLTVLLLSVHRRQGNFRHKRRRAWAWPRPQNWFDEMLASPRLNVLWKLNFRMERETFEELCRILSD